MMDTQDGRDAAARWLRGHLGAAVRLECDEPYAVESAFPTLRDAAWPTT